MHRGEYRAACWQAPRARSGQEGDAPRDGRGRHLTTRSGSTGCGSSARENFGPRTFRAAQSFRQRAGGARRAARARPRGAAVFPASVHAPLPKRDRGRAAGSARASLRLGEADYPPLLRLDDAPPLIAVMRQCRDPGAAAIAIVGSRNASRRASNLPSGSRVTSATRLRARLGPRARHRCCGPSRQPRDRHGRGSGRRSSTGSIRLSTPICSRRLPSGRAISEMPFGWEPRGQRFSAPQPDHLRLRSAS